MLGVHYKEFILNHYLILLPSKSASGPWHSAQLSKSDPVTLFQMKALADWGSQPQKSFSNVHRLPK